MGEIEIITGLAEANIKHGDSLVNAIDNAKKQFDFAVSEALNYEFKGFRNGNKINSIKRDYRNNLVNKHLGLVYSMAIKRYRGSVYYDDIVLEGTKALWEAMQSYVNDGNVTFTGYAYKVIHNRMMKTNINLCGAKRKVTKYKDDNGKMRTHEEVEFRDFTSLNMPVNGEDDTTELGELLGIDEEGYYLIEHKDEFKRILSFAIDMSSKGIKRYENLLAIISCRLSGLNNKETSKIINVSDVYVGKVLRYLGQDYLGSVAIK